MKRMRILQVISSSATSGAEKHVLQLSELLSRSGHHVEIICPPRGWLGQQCHARGIPVTEIDMKGGGWFPGASLVTRRLRECDLVHSHLTRATYFGAIAGGITRKPAIATVHIANHDQIYKRMARGRNRLVAVSQFVRGMLHGRGIGDRFIDTVYNGTDYTEIESHDPSEVRREFGFGEDRRLIGLVGRVCNEKGHLVMVKALRQVIADHPKAHVLFVGRIESSFEPVIREAIEENGLDSHVTLTGNRGDVPRLLDAFEFTAMPSHRETFGVAAIEAMARRRPVVASRVGGLTEVVRHQQTGLLIDLRPDELAGAIDYLLRNPREREQMGEYGRQVVEQKFTLRQMVQRLENLYERALADV